MREHGHDANAVSCCPWPYSPDRGKSTFIQFLIQMLIKTPKHSLQCRFANALWHYQMLVRLVDAQITKLVECSCTHLIGMEPNVFASAGPHHSSPLAQTTSSDAKFTDPMTLLNTVICWLETSSPDEFGSESEQILNTIMPISQQEFMNAQASVRCTPETVPGSHELCPSAYLRSRCEACFGGNHTLATAESYIGIVFSE